MNGTGAFIGEVHRIAARTDNRFELVAGLFNADPVCGRASATSIGIDPSRVYDNNEALLAAEARRGDGAEAVVIVTPNHLHGAAPMAALDTGFHVICEKPMTATRAEAEALAAHVRRPRAGRSSGRLSGSLRQSLPRGRRCDSRDAHRGLRFGCSADR